MSFFASSGASKRPEKAKTERPWVEKYRPKNVDEVAMQDQVVAVLKETLAGADMPHLLFYGPPGTGKTSTILAIARQLYGPDMIKERVLELNASDERGISVVRDKVKAFASLSANQPPSKGYPCPPYKIIILDECDSMTEAAQSALRRTMEGYSKVTRFCMICNYVSRIIDPLSSRCAKFRFKPLSLESQMATVSRIRDIEKVNCTDEVVETLVKLSGGDLRQAITFLQSGHRLKFGEAISVEDIEEIAGTVPARIVTELLTACQSKNYDTVSTFARGVISSAYPANRVVLGLHHAVMTADNISDIAKATIVERLAQADKALIDGADEELQLLDVSGAIMSALS